MKAWLPNDFLEKLNMIARGKILYVVKSLLGGS
jgi:hypothetical protein